MRERERASFPTRLQLEKVRANVVGGSLIKYKFAHDDQYVFGRVYPEHHLSAASREQRGRRVCSRRSARERAPSLELSQSLSVWVSLVSLALLQQAVQ
jgi:hypothetical protein